MTCMGALGMTRKGALGMTCMGALGMTRKGALGMTCMGALGMTRKGALGMTAEMGPCCHPHTFGRLRAGSNLPPSKEKGLRGVCAPPTLIGRARPAPRLPVEPGNPLVGVDGVADPGQRDALAVHAAFDGPLGLMHLC